MDDTPAIRLDASTPPAGRGARRWSAMAIVGTILSTILAGPCALGLVLSAVGLGGSGLGSAVAPLRPYLTALSIGCLGAGFYFTHLKRRARGKEGATACRVARGASWPVKALFWVTAALAFVFLGLPHLLA